MGWWPFRRDVAGRHALGAAVTQIPSGPLVLPVEGLAARVPAVPAEVPEVAAPSVEELLARFAPEQVQAVAAELDARAPVVAAVVPEPVVAEPACVSPVEPVVVVPLPAPPPFVPPAPPVLDPAVLTALDAGPRVGLGFRDGSTAELRPGSDSAVALQDLARLLTSG